MIRSMMNLLCISIVVSNSEALELKLSSVKSIHDLQQVCAAEGLELTDVEVAQKLIAEGGLPRYAHLSIEAQHQVASVLVLAEGDSQIAELIATPYEVAEQLPVLLAAHDIQLDPEALDALSQPLELDDAQLESVVGGSATLAIIGAIGAIVGPIATLWITEHYSAKVKVAELNAGKA